MKNGQAMRRVGESCPLTLARTRAGAGRRSLLFRACSVGSSERCDRVEHDRDEDTHIHLQIGVCISYFWKGCTQLPTLPRGGAVVGP
jgi:hypothetical protein